MLGETFLRFAPGVERPFKVDYWSRHVRRLAADQSDGSSRSGEHRLGLIETDWIGRGPRASSGVICRRNRRNTIVKDARLPRYGYSKTRPLQEKFEKILPPVWALARFLSSCEFRRLIHAAVIQRTSASFGLTETNMCPIMLSK
jgi:hypothetical protein